MTFLSLSLVSQSAGYTSSKLARLSIIILPFFYAAWVAISRVEDYVSVITISTELLELTLPRDITSRM
jgi:hypothetical protein